MATDLPPGYQRRRPTSDQLDDVVALMVAADVSEYGAPDTDRSDVVAHWGRPGFDLSKDAWTVVDPGGWLAGYAEAFDRGRYVAAMGVVRPDRKGLGLGGALVSLTEHWSHALLSSARPAVALRHTVSSVNGEGRALLETRHFVAARLDRRMVVRFPEPPPDPRWPDGVSVRTFDRNRDQHAVHELVQTAFIDIGDFAPSSFDAWSGFMMGGGGFDPSLWFVAEERNRVAGAILCYRFPDTGWVRQLAVARPFRGRGLGLALLRHAFGQLYRRGSGEVGLVVDSDNRAGAPRLYERAGMKAEREYITYERKVVAAA